MRNKLEKVLCSSQRAKFREVEEKYPKLKSGGSGKNVGKSKGVKSR